MAPRRRTAATESAPTAGQRLIAELAKPDDPFSLTFLIEQAAHIADYLEKLNALLKGDKATWLELKLGAKTVEVVVTNPLVQHRQFSEQLRKLLFEVHRQRISLPEDPPDDDPTNV